MFCAQNIFISRIERAINRLTEDLRCFSHIVLLEFILEKEKNKVGEQQASKARPAPASQRLEAFIKLSGAAR